MAPLNGCQFYLQHLLRTIDKEITCVGRQQTIVLPSDYAHPA
jgi:hypothetical protein